MPAVFDRKELLKVLRDFYVLTGIRAAMLDAWGIDMLSYPDHRPEYCRLVRQTEAGRTACLQCDQNACRQAREQRRALLYPCHAGLLEIITPILVDDTVVGYMLLSHIVQGADREAEWQFAARCCEKYGLPLDRQRRAFDALPDTPYEKLQSASHLLGLAARALYQERMAGLVPGSLSERMSTFLDEHLAEDLSGPRLCREFSMSRTALYQFARDQYGCGISEHIAKLRIRRAVTLLNTTGLSNAEVAAAVGIQDVNYFFRVFRKFTGLTPKKYREAARRGDLTRARLLGTLAAAPGPDPEPGE